MRQLINKEEKQARKYLDIAVKVAQDSNCLRAKCGAVIVSNKKVIGQGYNSPPQDVCLESCIKDSLPVDFKSDKTCCVHAEQRAIVDALVRNPEKIIGSQIYFARLDEQNKIKPSGKPYCTICSKFTLDVGISEFIMMYHVGGIFTYDTKEFNDLSFQYRETPKQQV